MKKFKLLFTLLGFAVFYMSSNADVSVIPRPQKITEESGSFNFSVKTKLITDSSTQREANYFNGILENAFGAKQKIASKGKGIKLIINKQLSNDLGDEGYRLVVNPKEIIIEGATNTGVFYGIQTLRQLLPPDFEFNSDKQKTALIKCVSIIDKPRFQWRDFMLDESRHFKGMEEVKRLLDQMAMLKMNVFHWHLTDDQGWRIEIKKYPKLTSVGGFRKDTQTVKHGEEREGKPHGGFYTQEQIREIVDYASERHIKIVPEIEMPGHATAAIAAYPWLGTLGTTTDVSVVFGKLPDSFNVANPKVITFLKDVLTEVFELFPGGIVHIGGDEVKFETWDNSSSVQAFMKKENLKSSADLQIYFTNLISQFVDSMGYRMEGWNEVLGDNVHDWQEADNTQLEQTLAKSTIVQFWKGSLELINKAVSNGYDVVNSYHAQTYLDYNYKTISLEKAYLFDPIPEGLDPKYNSKILGLGCQMWSEWIPTREKTDNQIFPRLAAYAEVGWTNKATKNYDKFMVALVELKNRWKLEGISYFEK